MTVKKSAPKKGAEGNVSVNQEPIPLQSKIIGGGIVLLFVGFSILWFVGKSILQGREESAIKHFESKGFTIEKGDIAYSGFPLSVEMTVPKLKVTRGDAGVMNIMLEGDEVTLSAAPWRPSRVTLTGPLSYGVYMGSTSVLSLKVGRVRADLSMGKDSKLELSDWKVYDVEAVMGDMDQKRVSIGEFSLSQEEKSDGDLTRLSSELEMENVNFSLPSGHPIMIQNASLEGSVSSPYKTADELSEAVQAVNKDFNKQLKKRCSDQSEFLPPLKTMLESVEKSGSHFDLKLKLKGGDYAAKLKLEGSVKDAFPHLALTAELKNLDKLLDSAVETGLLSPTVSRTATLFLSNVGKEKDGERTVDIRLEDRKLQMGDRVVWEFKEWDWDKLKLPMQYCKRLDAADAAQTKAQAAQNKGSIAGTLAGLAPAL